MVIYLVLALIFAVFVALFAVQNAGQVTINFLTWHWNTSVAVVILGAAAFGALFGALMASVREVQLKLKMRGLQSEIRRLEARVEEEEAESTRLAALLIQKGVEGN